MSPVLAAVAAVLLLACSEPVPPVATVAQPVTGGYPSGPEDDATVQLLNPSNTCSGVLVAPNLVMTARHCIAVVPLVDEDCGSDGVPIGDAPLVSGDFAPEDLAFYVGDGLCDGARSDHPPAAVGRLSFSTGSDTFCRNDVALVVLDRKIEGIEPLPMRMFSGVERTELVSVLGYSNSGSSGSCGRRRRDGVEVLDVGRSEYSSAASSLVDRTFAVGPGPCHGDSGGPALAASGAVVGVFSMLSGECQVMAARNIYTQIAAFPDLVFEAFDAADAEPWFEGEPAPGEDAWRSAGCSVAHSRGSSVSGTCLVLVALLSGVARARFVSSAAHRSRSDSRSTRTHLPA